MGDSLPTIVLVHGAYADSSSWNAVVGALLDKGYPVVATANPLRGVQSDAVAVAGVLDGIPGTIVLVGHAYGGSVITNAARGHDNVRALVYVSAYAPDKGETTLELRGRFPGSTLRATLAPPVRLSDGSQDLYIAQDKFPAQFAADVPAGQARLMAVTQRPINAAALGEASGVPAWQTIQSWFIYGDADKNIPPAAFAFMAQRAGARETVVVHGASHAVMVSHPEAVARIIETAAKAVSGEAPVAASLQD